MARRVAGAVALVLVAALLVATGCRRGAAQGGQGAGTQAAVAQAPQALPRTTLWRSAIADPTGSTAREPAAKPGDPPHIIHPIPGIQAYMLNRELPEDFVRVRVVQDDGVTPVAVSACRVGGQAAAGGPSEWFNPGGTWFVLGNPKEGMLTVQVRARGFDSVKRRVEPPPREERAKASRDPAPGKLTGPDVVIKMGKLRYRYLAVHALSPGRRPLVAPSAEMKVAWLGEDLRRTETVVLTTDAKHHSPLISLQVPEGAQRAQLRPDAGWLPADVELKARVVQSCLALEAYGSFVVTGVVTLPDGTPAEGAEAYLWVDGAYLDDARCDPEGRYRFDSVPAGRLTVVAAARGSDHSAPYRCEYDGAGDLTVPRLALGAGGCLMVTVRNPGEMVKCPVTLIVQTKGQSVGGKLLAGQTLYPKSQASPGVYGMQPLTPGEWSIAVDADGHEPGNATVQVVAGRTTTITITLVPHRSVQSPIVTADGKSVGATDVQCTLTYPPDPVSGRPRPPSSSSTVRTGTDGILRLGDLGEAQSLSVVTKHGHGRLDKLDRLASAAGRVTDKIRLSPPATVRGTIKLPGGVGLPRRGVAVALCRQHTAPGLEPLEEGWDELGSRPDDPLGDLRVVFEPKRPQFHFEGVVPADAKWKLYLYAPGLVAKPVPLNLTSGKTMTAEIEALTAGGIRGRVVDSRGRPVPNLGICGYMGTPGKTPEAELPRNRRTDADGVFEVGGLMPGEWYVLSGRGDDQACVRVQVKSGKTGRANLALVPQDDA